MKYRLTDAAVQDIREIVDYIRYVQKSPQSARQAATFERGQRSSILTERPGNPIGYASQPSPIASARVKTILVAISFSLAIVSVIVDLLLFLGMARDVPQAIAGFFVVVIAAPAATVTGVLAIRRQRFAFAALSILMALASLGWLGWMIVNMISA